MNLQEMKDKLELSMMNNRNEFTIEEVAAMINELECYRYAEGLIR